MNKFFALILAASPVLVIAQSPAAPLSSRPTIVFVENIHALLDAPGGKAISNSDGSKLGEGSSGEILQIKGSWAMISRGFGTFCGWIERKNIVALSAFRPLSAWKGTKLIKVEAGDYGATYRVKADGSFSATWNENNEHDDSYHMVTRKGHLYGFKNLVWAKVEGDPVGNLETRMFVRTANGSLCWQFDWAQGVRP